MSVLQREYENLKLKYPDTVIWFSVFDHVESFSECAVKTSNVLKTRLTKSPDDSLTLTSFPVSSLGENLKKMIKCGYKVALVESPFFKN